MNRKEILEKIRLYEIDLEFCISAGYYEAAADIENSINDLILQLQAQGKQ